MSNLNENTADSTDKVIPIADEELLEPFVPDFPYQHFDNKFDNLLDHAKLSDSGHESENDAVHTQSSFTNYQQQKDNDISEDSVEKQNIFQNLEELNFSDAGID